MTAAFQMKEFLYKPLLGRSRLSYLMDTGRLFNFPWRDRQQSDTELFNLVPKSKMRGVLSPCPSHAFLALYSWRETVNAGREERKEEKEKRIMKDVTYKGIRSEIRDEWKKRSADVQKLSMNTARGNEVIPFKIKIFTDPSTVDNFHAYNTVYAIVITAIFFHYLCSFLISFHCKVIHHLTWNTQNIRCFVIDTVLRSVGASMMHCVHHHRHLAIQPFVGFRLLSQASPSSSILSYFLPIFNFQRF